MSADIKNDGESVEGRSEGYDEFTKLIKKLGVDKMTIEERIDWLKKTDAETFLRLLSRANGRLVNLDKAQRWSGKATKTIVGNTYLHITDLEPPEHVEKDFTHVYEAIQSRINSENVKVEAAKLYAAIIYAHMFPNGNGRSARHVYSLLTKPDVSDSKLSASRGKIATELAGGLTEEGLKLVYKNKKMKLDGDKTYTIQDKCYRGTMGFLEYIAAKEVLENDGITTEGPIELQDLTPTQRLECSRKYEQLLQEFFYEVQTAVEMFADHCTEELDKVVATEPKS